MTSKKEGPVCCEHLKLVFPHDGWEWKCLLSHFLFAKGRIVVTLIKQLTNNVKKSECKNSTQSRSSPREM